MNPERIEAVLFDLDDTLCEYERTQEELLAIAFDRAGVEPFFDADTYRQHFGEFIGESDGIEDLRERCFAAIAEERGRDPALAREIAGHYADARDPIGVRSRPGALEAIEVLGERYPLGLVTNGGPELQRGKLERIGIEGRGDP